MTIETIQAINTQLERTKSKQAMLEGSKDPTDGDRSSGVHTA